MKLNKFSFSRFFGNNKIIFILSVIAAVAIWVGLAPEGEIDIKITTLNISTENDQMFKNSGLEAFSWDAKDIAVRVSGNNYIISTLSEKDIELNVKFPPDIDEAGTYPVTVTANAKSKKFKILSVSTDPVIKDKNTIDVYIDRRIETVFPISCKTSGLKIKENENFVADTAMLTKGQTSIKLKGPEKKIKSVYQVYAEANVNNTELTKTSTFDAEIMIVYLENTKDGPLEKTVNLKDEPLISSDIEADDQKITIPVLLKKDVAVTAVFINQPAAYNEFPIPHTLSAGRIKLLGPKDVVGDITEVFLAPIDFLKITPDKTVFDIGIEFPAGTRAESDITNVIVTVDLSGFSVKKFFISDFIQNGEKNTVPQTSGVNVTAIGPANIIKNLSSGDLYLEYDMETLNGSVGEHVVSAILRCRKSDRVWGAGSYSITVVSR